MKADHRVAPQLHAYLCHMQSELALTIRSITEQILRLAVFAEESHLKVPRASSQITHHVTHSTNSCDHINTKFFSKVMYVYLYSITLYFITPTIETLL